MKPKISEHVVRRHMTTPPPARIRFVSPVPERDRRTWDDVLALLLTVDPPRKAE